MCAAGNGSNPAPSKHQQTSPKTNHFPLFPFSIFPFSLFYHFLLHLCLQQCPGCPQQGVLPPAFHLPPSKGPNLPFSCPFVPAGLAHAASGAGLGALPCPHPRLQSRSVHTNGTLMGISPLLPHPPAAFSLPPVVFWVSRLRTFIFSAAQPVHGESIHFIGFVLMLFVIKKECVRR